MDYHILCALAATKLTPVPAITDKTYRIKLENLKTAFQNRNIKDHNAVVSKQIIQFWTDNYEKLKTLYIKIQLCGIQLKQNMNTLQTILN